MKLIDALRDVFTRNDDPGAPRHQVRGQYRPGPKAYVVCPYCTIEARTRDPRANLQGVWKQRFAQHLATVHGIDARRATVAAEQSVPARGAVVKSDG